MWPRWINSLLGIWLMAAPAVLGYGDPASTNDRIAGPIVATIALCAAWSVLRPLRWLNLAVGLWLIAAPVILGFELTPALNSVATGAAVAALACVRARLNHQYGGGWSSLWRSDAPATRPDACTPRSST